MEILNYTIVQVLWHANEWNLIINSQDVIARSIENILAFKKKITINFCHKKIGHYNFHAIQVIGHAHGHSKHTKSKLLLAIKAIQVPCHTWVKHRYTFPITLCFSFSCTLFPPPIFNNLSIVGSSIPKGDWF
jgi:hypothetical protein